MPPTIFDLITEDPELAAAIDALPTGQAQPLEGGLIRGLTMACLIYQEKEAYICLYMAADAQKVKFKEGADIFKTTINRDSLEGFIGEFRADL